MISNALKLKNKKETRGKKSVMTSQSLTLLVRHSQNNSLLTAVELKLASKIEESVELIKKKVRESNLYGSHEKRCSSKSGTEEMPIRWVYQQYKDPKYTSKLAKQWLLTSKVEVIDWLAQLPDLNPIVNLCRPTTTIFNIWFNQPFLPHQLINAKIWGFNISSLRCSYTQQRIIHKILTKVLSFLGLNAI